MIWLRDCRWGLGTGILLALAYPSFSLAPLAWIAFLPLLWGLYHARDNREAFWQSAAAGLTFFLSSCYWTAHVSFVGYLLLCIYLSLFFVPFGLAVRYFYLRRHSAILWGSLFWVGAEFLRGRLLSGFPWNTLASSQARFLEFIQMASVTGAYGVSFIIIMVNCVLFEVGLVLRGHALKYFRTLMVGALGLVASALIYGYLELREADKMPSVGPLPIALAAIQPNVSQGQKWDPSFRSEILSRLRQGTMEAAKSKPLLVVWPETSVPGEIRHDSRLKQFAEDLAKESGCNLLIGSQDSTDELPRMYFNAAVLFDPHGQIIQVYRKIHLVPFGEFLPLAKWFPFLRWFIPIPEDFSPGKEETVFQILGPTFRWREPDGTLRSEMELRRFGVVICFEDIFSEPFRRYCSQRLSFMVNITNDAWFKKSGASVQHANLAVFRAVENRIPLLRATNTGYTCLIDPYGRIQADVGAKGNLFVPGVLVAQITPRTKKTIYSELGDFFASACLILALVRTFMLIRERTRQ